MGWEDRPYYRDQSGPSANPLLRIISGSLPLFTAFGIRVRAHAAMILFVALTILMPDPDFPVKYRFVAMGFWVAIVILHEFGHCFAARWVGGSADEILLWPLGGLTFCEPPRRPLPTFLTVAAGPAVNLVLCVVALMGMYATTPTWSEQAYAAARHLSASHITLTSVSLNPFNIKVPFYCTWSDPAFYFWWIFIANYALLLLNLIPVYPMDGGQMLQAALWPAMGLYRSEMFATMAGMIGSIFVGVIAIACHTYIFAFFMAWCFYASYQRRLALRENGPEDWRDSVDYSASIYAHHEEKPPKKRKVNRRALKTARRIAQQEKAERDLIDEILAKVSGQGMTSLTWRERRTLRKATESQRRREVELSRYQ